MIVVDVNVIAYFWLPGEMTSLAEKVFERDPGWVTSILWRSEFRNVLAGHFRRGTMSRDDIQRCIDGAESQFNGYEYILPSMLVMNKVSKSVCSAYDCEYVALAEDLGTVLVTADKQILNEFPRLAVGLSVFCQ